MNIKVGDYITIDNETIFYVESIDGNEVYLECGSDLLIMTLEELKDAKIVKKDIVIPVQISIKGDKIYVNNIDFTKYLYKYREYIENNVIVNLILTINENF